MNLGEQFSSEVVTAEPEESIVAVVNKMDLHDVGAVVVVDEKKVVGIVTDRDIALSLGRGNVSNDAPVSQIMTTPVLTIWEDQGVFNATQYLMGHKVRRLPIVNHDDELVGMVTLDDLMGLLAQEMANLGKAVAPALAVKGH
ncbi:MAG: CBS domain-containing protein [Planctomycetes bacterium]|nr:CBS domain-containing protein [Planctomycetota bacterium]